MAWPTSQRLDREFKEPAMLEYLLDDWLRYRPPSWMFSSGLDQRDLTIWGLAPMRLIHGRDGNRYPGDSRLVTGPLGVVLLWALALEIDERMATQTGDMVCRACSGWGERIADLARGPFVHPGFVERARRHGTEHLIRVGKQNADGRAFRLVAVRCACKHKDERPHTVELHRVVAQLAAMRSPIVTDWPEPWLVDLDAMEANGWRETWLPSQCERPKVPTRLLYDDGTFEPWDRARHPTPEWICTWWRAFAEWAQAGKVPDAGELAALLQPLVEVRQMRSRLRDWAARLPGTRDSLRAAALSVPGVTGAAVIENRGGEPAMLPRFTAAVVYTGDVDPAVVVEAVEQVRPAAALQVFVWRRADLRDWDGRVVAEVDAALREQSGLPEHLVFARPPLSGPFDVGTLRRVAINGVRVNATEASVARDRGDLSTIAISGSASAPSAVPSGPITVRIEGTRGRIEAVDCMLDDIQYATGGAWSIRFVTRSRPRPEWSAA